MKILTASQLQWVDKQTIERQQIASIDLMERAAKACVKRILDFVNAKEILVFCGMGNNGGDGLAIVRLLHEEKKAVRLVIAQHSDRFSRDAQVNLDRLAESLKKELLFVKSEGDLNQLHIPKNTLVIDALLGTGVNKPLTGILKSLAEKINQSGSETISIDVPSGLFIDSSSSANLDSCVHASRVLSFQLPKLAFLLPENKACVPIFEILDIGLDQKAICEQKTDFYYNEFAHISKLLIPRKRFSHKGTYGHALLFAGSVGKVGAALIASEACLRSGVGLLTLHSVQEVIHALNVRLPEAMSRTDVHPSVISMCGDLDGFQAIGFGPGVGMEIESQRLLKQLLERFSGKWVIDADGLNILAENPSWLELLSEKTILTPHPKEFERLVGSFSSDFDRLEKARSFAQKYRVILILKDTFTHICLPDGRVFFNSTGNSGLAKGGSGDALTGILLGLLARAYSPEDAARIGTYVHGLAADLCAESFSKESMLITDVIHFVPNAWKQLESLQTVTSS